MHGIEILRCNGFPRMPLFPSAAPSQGLGWTEGGIQGASKNCQ